MGESRPNFVATADRQGNAPEGKRWRTAFVWELVEPKLLRRLLAAVGSDADAALNALDRAALVDVAQTVFGAQVPQRAMGRVGPVLMEYWLPAAREDSLARLTQITQTALGKAYRDQHFRGRARQLAFLQDRRRTKNFYDNLRDAFHREHRGSWLISKGASAEQAQSVYRLRGAGQSPAYAPYAHTVAAWDELDRLDRAGPVRGLVVLPTGAGRPTSPSAGCCGAWSASRICACSGSPTRSRCSIRPPHASRPSRASSPSASTGRCASSPAAASRRACSTAARPTWPAPRSRRSRAAWTAAAGAAPRSRASCRGRRS